MKELRGSAVVTVPAPASECLALLTDVGAYPSWCPRVVPRTQVIDAGDEGTPALALATVRLGVGPLRGDFDLKIEVCTQADRVVLTRVPNEPSDPEQLSLLWRVAPGPPTRLAVELAGRLDVPRLLPLGGVADSVAQELLGAARQALELGRS